MYVYAQEIGRAVVCSEVKTFFLGVDMRNLVSYLKKKKKEKNEKDSWIWSLGNKQNWGKALQDIDEQE